MPDFQHKPNSGSVFPNEYKREDRHPDMKGKALVNGVLYDVAMWKKSGNRGEWFSLSFSIPQQRQQQGHHQPQQSRSASRPSSQRPSAAEGMLNKPYPGEPADTQPPMQDSDIPF